MSEILFVLLLGHFIADFLLQPDKVAEMKKKEEWKTRHLGLLIHTGIHVVINLAILLWLLYAEHKVNWSQVLFILLIVFVTHYLIDWGKLKFLNIKHVGINAFLYVLDQLLHIVVIAVTLYWLEITQIPANDVFNFIKQHLFSRNSFSNLDKILLTGMVLIITTHFFGYLLQILLKNIKPVSNYVESKEETITTEVYKLNEFESGPNKNLKPDERKIKVENTDVNYVISQPSFEIGRYIGMMERIVIMVLVATNAYTGITFLVAIKALTRFKQFDDKNFAEYYLIGSLLSVLLGICSGFLVKYILLT